MERVVGTNVAGAPLITLVRAGVVYNTSMQVPFSTECPPTCIKACVLAHWVQLSPSALHLMAGAGIVLHE